MSSNFNQSTGRIILPTQGNAVNVPLTDTDNTVRTEAVIKPYMIPVIFLPGIMGSNLKAKKDFEGGRNQADNEFVDNYLWNFDIPDPDQCMNQAAIKTKAIAIENSVSKDKAKKVWNVFNATDPLDSYDLSARERQQNLNPDKTTVDYYPLGKKDGWKREILNKLVHLFTSKGPGIFSDDGEIDFAIALMRGWGSVSKSSYWDFLIQLQKSLDAMPDKQQIALACQNIEQEFRASPLWQELLEAEKPKKQEFADSKLTVPMYSNIYDPNGFQQTSRKEDMGKIEPNKHLFGKEQPSALSEGALTKAINYRYLVYACGYNWLHSNIISANGSTNGDKENTETGLKDSTDHHHLTKVIDKILENVQKSDPTCKQVILVTHSMGGLVARAYTKSNVDKVLGVVHGVMPATGAAAFYKRIRAGFGGVEGSKMAAKVLGDDGYKTSAVMTHAIGALELAPSDSYGDSFSDNNLSTATTESGYQSWLKVYQGHNVLMQSPTPIGDKTNPFLEIYKSNAWYGLVPSFDPELDNNPDFIKASDKDKQEGKHDSNPRIDPMGNFNYRDEILKINYTDIQYFHKNIDLANQFHQSQVTKTDYHPNTYACVIIDRVNEKGKYNAYGNMVMKIKETNPPITNIAEWTLIEDKGEGNIKLRSPDKKTIVTATMTKPMDKGDSTVPGISAIAPAPYVKELWELSDGEHDHQGSWQAHNAQLFALYAISKISKQRR